MLEYAHSEKKKKTGILRGGGKKPFTQNFK